MGWSDERSLILTSYIGSLLILVTLDVLVGVVSFLFTYAYSAYKKIQFSKSGKYVDLPTLAIAIILSIGIYNIVEPLGIFISFKEFVIDNPILKVVVFGVFLPLPETLFFFGVLMPWLAEKLKIRLGVNVESIIVLIVLGLVVSVWHIKSQIMTRDNIIADIAFFGLSGASILYFKELKQSYYTHVFTNTRTIMIKEGLLKVGGILL